MRGDNTLRDLHTYYSSDDAVLKINFFDNLPFGLVAINFTCQIIQFIIVESVLEITLLFI